jgi:hypothetical protein
VTERFVQYGFDKLFKNFNEMAEETQWHQFASLKYEIESIRSFASIQGYVITGITDVHWEVNGLLDMWRNEKSYARELGRLQRADLLICRLGRHNFYSSESVEVPVLFSRYSNHDLKGARVRWFTSSGATGTFAVPQTIEPGSVAEVGTVRFVLPEVDKPRIERLEVEVRLGNGNRWTENSYDLFVFPQPPAPASIPLKFSGFITPHLEHQLHAAGYGSKNNSLPKNQGLMVAGNYNADLTAHLQQGGRAVLLVDSETVFPVEWPIVAKVRAGSELDGRWFSNYNWIRPEHAPFSNLAFTRILGFESARVAPHYVIQNVPSTQFDDVLSGITYGWLNENSALALRTNVGPGRLLVTTYRFADYGSDPYATCLLNSFLSYTASPSLVPGLEMPLVAQEVPG